MQSRPTNPVINAIVQMGENCALSQEEVYHKLSKAYDDDLRWLNEPDTDGYSPLIRAVSTANPFAVEWLLDSRQHEGATVQPLYSRNNLNALELAVSYEDKTRDSQINPSVQRNIAMMLNQFYNKTGSSRLKTAMQAAHHGNLQYLYTVYKEFGGLSHFGNNVPAIIGSAALNNQIEVLKFLFEIENESTLYDKLRKAGRNIIGEALSKGLIDIAEFLITKRYYIRPASDENTKSLTQSLLEAILNKQITIPKAQSLLVPVIELDGHRLLTREVLSLAIEIGDAKIVKIITGKNAACIRGNHKGKTAIIQAAQLGKVDVLSYLMSMDSTFVLNEKVFLSSRIYSPTLTAAASFGRIDAVKHLLKQGAKFSIDIVMDKNADQTGWARVNRILDFNKAVEKNRNIVEAFKEIDPQDKAVSANILYQNSGLYGTLAHLIPNDMPVVEDTSPSAPLMLQADSSKMILSELKQAEVIGELPSTTEPASAPIFEVEGYEPGAANLDEEKKMEEPPVILPPSLPKQIQDPNLVHFFNLLKTIAAVDDVWKGEDGQALRDDLKNYTNRMIEKLTPSQEARHSLSL